MTAPASVLDRLRAHRTLGDLPLPELEWLVAHGEMRLAPVGTVVAEKMVPAPGMYIIFRGRVVIRVDRGAGEHKLVEWGAGEVTGALPYSRGGKAPENGIAEAEMEYLDVPRTTFPEMIVQCPALTARLVHVMLDRVRVFTSADLRDEKLISLGKLSAGLAHELNNPASAAMRAAKAMTESQLDADAAARRLGAAQLSAAQLAAVDAIRDACRAAEGNITISALERADREDAIGDWLNLHGATQSCAGPLAETAVTIAQLDELAAALPAPALDAALCWLSSSSAMRSLATAVEISTARISEIVRAVKGFTYMDQAAASEAVDIRRGIREAITMLGAKVRTKAADISVNIPDDLPTVRATGAELNQIWLNLIDNALDAIDTRGRVEITARLELSRVIVEVIDNGSGIPPEMLWRIFEPFFTTKAVGQGTGLGLDIVRRLLQRQDGAIEAESELGRTIFRVFLPLADASVPAVSAQPPRRHSTIVGPHSD